MINAINYWTMEVYSNSMIKINASKRVVIFLFTKKRTLYLLLNNHVLDVRSISHIVCPILNLVFG